MIQRIRRHAVPSVVAAALIGGIGSAVAQSTSSGQQPSAAQTAPAGDARELLGRARSANEGQMVEELIRKLGGAATPAAGPGPSTATPAVAPSSPASGSPPRVSPPPQVTHPSPTATPVAAEPPTANTPVQVERRAAERRRMPRPMSELMASRRQGAPLAAPIPESTAMPAPTPASTPASTPAQPQTQPIATARPAAKEPAPPAARPLRGPPPRRAATEQPQPQTIQPPAALTPSQVERMDALPHINVEVLFVIDSADLTTQAFATLAIVGRALSDPRLAKQVFLIAGHTDASGPYDYNVALSARRAEVVREFLIEHFAIAPERLLARGFGPDRLRSPGNPYGRVNRRVQVVNWTSELDPSAGRPVPPPPPRR